LGTAKEHYRMSQALYFRLFSSGLLNPYKPCLTGYLLYELHSTSATPLLKNFKKYNFKDGRMMCRFHALTPCLFK
jgi:hypothetical protein